VTLGYTPAALRSGFAEREGAERSTGRSMGPTMTTTDATTAAARQIRRIGKGSATSATWKFDCGLWSTVPQWRMHSLSARVLCPLRAVLEGGDSLVELERANSINGNYDNDDHDNKQTNKYNNNHTVPNDQEVILELAAFVATGGILPTPGGVTAAADKIAAFCSGRNPLDHAIPVGRDVAPCLTVDLTRLFLEWDSLASLSRSMAF